MIGSTSFSKRLKKIILTLVAFPAFLTAQPYLSTNNQWTNRRTYIISQPPPYYQTSHYFVKGDSLINNKPYKKIFRSFSNCGNNNPFLPGSPGCNIPPSPPALAALIREVGSRWFILTPQGQDSLLYRFDLVKGDSVLINSQSSFAYVKIDTVFVNHNNSGRKLFHVKDLNGVPSSPDVNRGYIEGVGPSTGFLSSPNFFPFEDWEELICYRTLTSEAPCLWFTMVSVDEITSKPSSGFLYPNPTHGEVSVNLLKGVSFTHLKVTDMLGTLVLDRQNMNDQSVIDVGLLKTGIYLVEIESEIGTEKCKLIKED